MNAMTIILSTTASLLVAALILFWQNDNASAKDEPLILQQQFDAQQIQIEALKTKIRTYERAMANKERGIPDNSSPYSSGLKGQAEFASDSQKLEAAQIQSTQIQDRLTANQLSSSGSPILDQQDAKEDLSSAEMTSSALAAATGGDPLKSTTQNVFAKEQQLIDSATASGIAAEGESLTENQQQRRRNDIRKAKIYAVVSFIDSSPDGDIILAKMAEGAFVDEGSILVVRRQQTGIAGKVKIVSITNYPGQGNVATIQPASKGFGGSELILQENDELILPPTWDID